MPQMKASVKATTSTLKLLRVLLSRDFVPEVRRERFMFKKVE